MTTTDTPTPCTDAVPCNQAMLSAQSDPVEVYHKLIAVTLDFGKALDACAEYREQLDESTADLMRTQIEMQLEIDRAEAEVERLKELLNRAINEIEKTPFNTPKLTAFTAHRLADRYREKMTNTSKKPIEPQQDDK